MQADLLSDGNRQVRRARRVPQRGQPGDLRDLCEGADRLAVCDPSGVITLECEVAERIGQDGYGEGPHTHDGPRQTEERPRCEDRQDDGPVLEGEQPQVPTCEIGPLDADERRDQRTGDEPDDAAAGDRCDGRPGRIAGRNIPEHVCEPCIGEPVRTRCDRIREEVTIGAMVPVVDLALDDPRQGDSEGGGGPECREVRGEDGAGDDRSDAEADSRSRRGGDGDERDDGDSDHPHGRFEEPLPGIDAFGRQTDGGEGERCGAERQPGDDADGVQATLSHGRPPNHGHGSCSCAVTRSLRGCARCPARLVGEPPHR